MHTAVSRNHIGFNSLSALVFLCLAASSLSAQQAPPLELVFDRPATQFVATPAPPVGPQRGVPGSTFDIQVNFVAPVPSASQQLIFAEAEAAWEARINRYVDNVTISGLVIDASAPPIDGPGGILGSAGPTIVTDQEGFTYSTAGVMNFDSADLDALESGGVLRAVIEHEMGHVIAVGTLWGPADNNVYVFNSGEYTGAAGVAEWNSEFGQAGTVDVELDGGPGTANGHWNEVAGGAGLVGITDSMGRDMRDALMTGWLNSGPLLFYSSLTHEHLKDVGFVVFDFSSIFQDGFESGNTTAWN